MAAELVRSPLVRSSQARFPQFRTLIRWFVPALALVAGAVAPAMARTTAAGFPAIRVWSLAGTFQDSSSITTVPQRCVGAYQPRPDSLRRSARALSVRWLRDRVAEARPDFGGYRIYRMVNSPDTSHAELIRRFSLNTGSELTWAFSTLDDTTMQYICKNRVVNDSILTFVDPDSNGSWLKVCRKRIPQNDPNGRCNSIGDSTFVLIAPPGPHDGFLTWYSITYEQKNTTDTDYQDLFIPDTLDAFARCGTPGVRNTCPNLNNKLANLTGPTEPTAGPTLDLETVRAVPNPYRGHEVWDQPGASEIHFINLPKLSTIRIYTASGDLVRTISHDDPVRDFERWDLRNSSGREVASGIYMYRVVAGSFSFQNRLIVIR